jgi:hypothetical protein
LLVPVTVCEGLVVPTETVPKLRLVGLTVKLGGSASALGDARPTTTKRSARLKTENAERNYFGRAMINPPKKATL